MDNNGKLPIPAHVAIILDGNGRWAKKRNMPRTYGHAQGSKNVEKICRAADKMGIKYITFYAFSTENWKRPDDEVKELMRLLGNYLEESVKKARDNNMRVRVIGDRKGLSDKINEAIDRLEEDSKDHTGLTMTIALNYGGRDELVRTFRKLTEKGLKPEEITEKVICDNLDTADMPDPDLLIRTSGEQRLSNYLIWQLAYSEFYFTDILWPDFTEKDLADAVAYYQSRNRRFGGV